ncbi:GNAT family N-acetyltransferase [Ancylobacter sp. 6x-1]|uniref:GNAT family N-acetyltransferase n=1 Tax=Ancylobacter crimeensis TaxID=2579147 RepID=A0ABT0D8N9_9HYPH|nr:GNAT family N-acetyltransferase [Ancylobacter crimeensis]
MSAAPAASLRPALPADAETLAALMRASIFALTGDDYDEDQQEAWAAAADDEEAFAAGLAGRLTLVATRDGEPVGFVALADNRVIDLLYVHPEAAGQGVGTLLCDAIEKLAAARGATVLTADASDTALAFFQKRGYVAQSRNSVPRGDVWLGNTTVQKKLGDGAA